MQLRIFHLKQRAQNEQAWFKQESRKDNQETSLRDFVVSFGSLEQKLELERDCGRYTTFETLGSASRTSSLTH